jgi:transposase-like protein
MTGNRTKRWYTPRRERKMNEREQSKAKERRMYSAREKAEAVLALWTEKRRPTEVCQEIGISTTLLMSWQERALEGMLGALEPRTRAEEDRGPRLGRKLEKLLEEKTRVDGPGRQRLARRLIRVQKGTLPPTSEASPAGNK